MPLLFFIFLFMATPSFAHESILLNVNQTHSLQWDWQSEGSAVRSFVFQCQQYRKELDADARSLRFGSLVDEPGRYTGCSLAAKNEAGLSAPVLVPDFDYAYSYKAFGLLILEMFAVVSAVSGAVAVSGRSMLGWVRTRRRQTAPMALPEPSIILEKEREHVYRYR